MTTITTMKQRNIEAGHHFFDAETMRFFDSYVSRTTYGDFFVTSDKGPDGVRRYTVRYSDPNTGHVETIGTFQQFDNQWSALAEARRLHLTSLPCL